MVRVPTVTKPKTTKVAIAKAAAAPSSASSSSSSSSSLTLTSVEANSLLVCSQPVQRNGATRYIPPLLSKCEAKLFTKQKIELKQMAALVILKCGLGIAEGPTVPQIVQEEKFMENFTKLYETLRKDPIIGQGMSRVPMKFLNITKSTASEVMSGVQMRNK
jgi:hypothetical protein